MEELANLADESSVLLPLVFGGGEIFILDKDSRVFPESDRGLFKAVINGYNVDTRQFVIPMESHESPERTEEN